METIGEKRLEQEHIKMNNLDETLEKARLFFILAENESNEEKPDIAFVERHIRWAKDQLYIYTSEISRRAYTKKIDAINADDNVPSLKEKQA